MRKFRLGFGFGILLACLALGSALGEQDEIFGERRRSILSKSKIFSKHKTPIHKALFTQRGYIQFLRWELPVPEIEEFTYCLWVKSTNLTYSHSIFSYSKNEEKRLVSSRISPFGRSIHLEIGEIEIMAHPTNLREHRWYHVCQSWENQVGRYGLWIDGLKEVEGYAPQLIGHVIPSKGDIVVGQEYTDFDKGFEEGIEGAVVGFNLVLSSAFDRSPNYFPAPVKNGGENLPAFINNYPAAARNRGVPQILRSNNGINFGGGTHPGIHEPPAAGEQGAKIFNQRRESAFDSTLKEYLGDDNIFDGESNIRSRGLNNGRQVIAVKFVHKTKRDTRRRRQGRGGGRGVPLGLQLIDLSYNHCEIGRGSPFIGGSKMLISWTRTPVKVFGGAIIKDAKSTCGNF